VADIPFTALVLAGSRAEGDPLAAASGVAHKAVTPIAGVPMLGHVLAALRAATNVDRIVICGLDPALLPVVSPAGDAGWRAPEAVAGAATPGASAARAIEVLQLVPPLLITTADHPLLTATTIDEFCSASRQLAADVSFGIVPARLVSSAFPGIRRTHYRFRDDSFCGCNLYGLLTSAGCTAPTQWMQVERYRKRPWRMVQRLGPAVLMRFLLGRLSLSEVTALVYSQFGVRAEPVRLSEATAGFDVDTPAQRQAAEAYLRRRAVPGQQA
jgi:GTP:adenosylcobinamide-phosphate guanylyltransferase